MLSSKSTSQVYKRARQTGALSLVGLELHVFPIEVCTLHAHYEADEKIWENVELAKIDMSHNNIDSLPSELALLKDHLTYLKLSQNRLCTIDFFSLCNLVFLDLSHNALTGTLPSEMDQFQQLKEFDVSYNQLTAFQSIPDSLEHLNFQHNVISSLPETLAHCVHLRTLKGAGNRLTALPALNGCTRLEFIDVSKNAIHSMLDLQLPGLTCLDIRQNQLQHCPKVSSLALDCLLLGYNQITRLDGTFQHIQSTFMTLDVIRDNQLASLPEDIWDSCSNSRTF